MTKTGKKVQNRCDKSRLLQADSVGLLIAALHAFWTAAVVYCRGMWGEFHVPEHVAINVFGGGFWAAVFGILGIGLVLSCFKFTKRWGSDAALFLYLFINFVWLLSVWQAAVSPNFDLNTANIAVTRLLTTVGIMWGASRSKEKTIKLKGV